MLYCKKGDEPEFREILYDKNNDIVALSDNMSFFMINDMNADDTHNVSCDSANTYIVTQLTTAETANSGMYRCGYIIEYPDGVKITVPDRGNMWLNIGEK